MMKVLYTATSDIHLATFHLPYIKWLKEQGYEVHLAMEKRGDISFTYADKIFYLPFPRSPLNRQNISTYRSLKRIIDGGNYHLIHCHTPLPGVLTRLAARRSRKQGSKVLYTAHGFHFYKGAPQKYWWTFYPAEYLMSYFTDCLITLNTEDYLLAKKKLKSKQVYHLKGIGVNNAKFRKLPTEEMRNARAHYGYADNHFLLMYTAEFIPRKNHQFIIESLPALSKKIPSLRIIFAGKGTLMNEMMDLVVKLKVEHLVQFLGFRSDLGPLVASVDLGVSASKQEGLPLGVAELMMSGVPVVATSERGHRELVVHNYNGLLYPQLDKLAFVEQVVKLYHDELLRKRMGENAMEHLKQFTVEKSIASMAEIYRSYVQ